VACYKPLTAYRSRSGRNAEGNWPVVFNLTDGYIDKQLKLPCNQCIGCRLERSRTWAVRCVHEASLHQQNCFVTLTYNNKHLPANGSLRPADMTKFLKRLRKKFGNGIRYFQCGEYGDKFARPHHHICLFGFDFTDKTFWKDSNGVALYRSKTLEKLWKFGYSSIGDVNFESAAYVARYVTKKVNGKLAEKHYEVINKETGEVTQRKPEYITMSRRPGIAKNWYSKFKGDVFPSDFIVIRNGIKSKPPRYYDSLYDIEYPEKFKKIKLKRQALAHKHQENSTDERLKVREFIKTSQAKQLKRSYENESILN